MRTLHEIYANSSHLSNYSNDKFKSHLNKRFCSIGRARRFDLLTDEYSPGPGKYSPILKSRIKKASFGTSPRKSPIFLPDSPGPGSYSIPVVKGPSFSMGKRLIPIVSKVPGPGHYKLNNWGSRSKQAIFGSEVRKNNFLDPSLSENPEPWKYHLPGSSSSPKWKFGSEPRVKPIDISKLGVFEAMLHIQAMSISQVKKFE